MMKIPIIDWNVATPLFKVIFLGHPSCPKFCGKDLARVIRLLLEDFEIYAEDLVKGFVGGTFDGQYLNLNVLRELGEQVGIHNNVYDRWVDMWDPPHLIERALADVIANNEHMTSTIKEISSLIVFIGHGKTYEALVDVHLISGTKVYQPKTIKTMKFASHSLYSLVNFIREYNDILQALSKLKDAPTDPLLTDDERAAGKKRSVEAKGYHTNISDPKFLLTLFFTKDFLVLISLFSKSLQKKDMFISDCYNYVLKLLHCLTNINFGYDPETRDECDSKLTDNTKALFPKYFGI